MGSIDCLKHQDFEARWEEPSLGLCADNRGAQVPDLCLGVMAILACRFFLMPFWFGAGVMLVSKSELEVFFFILAKVCVEFELLVS